MSFSFPGAVDISGGREGREGRGGGGVGEVQKYRVSRF